MKPLVTFLLWSALASPAVAQDAALEAPVRRFFEGLSQLNDSLVRSTVTGDFQLLEVGEVWTLDTLLHHMAPMRGRGIRRENNFSFLRTEQQGNSAWASYHNTAVFSTAAGQQQTIRWLESVVLLRINGVWKIRMMHSTRIQDPK
ncbi:hypothetical protein [Flaviaesturariibacter amylovorans]|uniref:Nuclear transport factor 2 family protein n=1 Tax=Flaviaesturariibacter amylovorans TaxID=1084520 RepID=A0ABP8HU76_9BACT